MTPREEVISKILSEEEWFELNDEAAVEVFDVLVKNKHIVDNLKNNYLFIDNGNKKINTKIINWNINEFETDSIEEMVDGSLDFRGSCYAVGFDNPLMFVIKVRDFLIYEAWAVDMDDNTEIAFIEQGKYVRRMERETYQSGPQTYSNRYKFIFRGNV